MRTPSVLPALIGIVMLSCAQPAAVPSGPTTAQSIAPASEVGTSVTTAAVPVGAFRLTPRPNATGTIALIEGQELRVNAARFTDPDGGSLRFTVDWGDGARDSVLCGICRVTHLYRNAGSYIATATVWDRRLSDPGVFDQAWRVNVASLTTGNGPPAGSCTGSLTQYCQLAGGRCPTYQEAVERRSALCSQPGSWNVETHLCAGLYRSVSWRESLLGGGEEYFSGEGQLIAAKLFTDYFAYCDGTSFSQTFGAPPLCPTQRISTALCMR